MNELDLHKQSLGPNWQYAVSSEGGFLFAERWTNPTTAVRIYKGQVHVRSGDQLKFRFDSGKDDPAEALSEAINSVERVSSLLKLSLP